jgi:hypothetical protein
VGGGSEYTLTDAAAVRHKLWRRRCDQHRRLPGRAVR